MIPIREAFCVLSAVIAISCCIGLFIINDDLYTAGNYPQRTTNTNPDKVCESSASYDHLSVIPEYTRPIARDTEWVCNLYRVVKQFKERQVTLLVCNKNYLDVLVNWLAHSVLYALHPVDSILIIAFDSYTYHVLHSKGFHSVHISLQALSNLTTKTKDSVSNIWITRLTVTRLLNHWNYSVLVFDSDAIMIKNIQPLLDKFSNSDIVASAGSFPHDLNEKWKAPTICMGVILMKCSPATG